MAKSKIVVIGAGIVGLSCALALKKLFGEKVDVTVIERNFEPFSETSRYNSGVVHSGIHQHPNLLKSKLAPIGGRLLIEFCEERNVLFRRTGMLIAAASKDLISLTRELFSLFRLRKNSRRLNLKLEFLGRRGIEKIEPNIRAFLGIYLSEVWVVDQVSLGKALLNVCLEEGVSAAFGAEVRSIIRCRNLYEVISEERNSHHLVVSEANIVVNAAGVSSAIVSEMARFAGHRIYPCRGEYYEVLGPKRDLISETLIYPALPPGHPVKGIHLTKTIDGRLLIGPNAKPWQSTYDNFTVQTAPKEFLDGARRFLPELTEPDLKWAYSGLRAKTNPGIREDDFIIRFESGSPTFVNLIGIESPGFTAGLAIGDYVANWVRELCLIR